MKAIVFTKYGPPEKVKVKEIEKPTPTANEVLVRVHATAINDYDWSLVRGRPYAYRLLFGLTKPKWQIPGMEVAGTVETIGDNVTLFKVGDEVYGDTSTYGFGCFAEYVCVHEKALVHKPAQMSFEEATTIPHAAMLAYQGLIDVGRIQKGQQILINGAGGGVGTFGLQIGKLHAAEVTGVDTGDKLEMMRELGFDHIIDYKKEDFTRNGKHYDLILDCKTNRPTKAYVRSLKPNGCYATVGGTLNRLLQAFLWSPVVSLFYRKKIRIVALKPNKDLDYINKLYEEGRIKCAIDGPYALEEIPRLIQYFGEGKHSGKVVISIKH